MRSLLIALPTLALLALAPMAGCADDDDGGTAADNVGVGAECAVNDDCTEADQTCLTQFKGGYCGVADCQADSDCPSGSLCVTHDDGANYCFLECVEKTDCNRNRSVDNESNCVGSVTFVNADNKGKACEPPAN